MTELIIRYAEPSGIADKTVIPSEVVGTLVRCKDCEYYKCCEVFNPKKITENDFCSWAEMKGGAE